MDNKEILWTTSYVNKYDKSHEINSFKDNYQAYPGRKG